MNSLISFLLTSSDSALIPSLYLSCPSLTCALMSDMSILVTLVEVLGKNA